MILLVWWTGLFNGETITIAGTKIGMGAGTTANDISFTVKTYRMEDLDMHYFAENPDSVIRSI